MLSIARAMFRSSSQVMIVADIFNRIRRQAGVLIGDRKTTEHCQRSHQVSPPLPISATIDEILLGLLQSKEENSRTPKEPTNRKITLVQHRDEKFV